MTLLQFTEDTLHELEWAKAYSRSNLSNSDKVELIEHYLNKFHVPIKNQQELIITFSTILPESPEYNLLQTFLKNIGLVTCFIKLGTKEHLSIQIKKGYFK